MLCWIALMADETKESNFRVANYHGASLYFHCYHCDS